MEELMQKRTELREKYFQLMEQNGIPKHGGEMLMEKLLSAAYNWGFIEGYLAEKRGEKI